MLRLQLLEEGELPRALHQGVDFPVVLLRLPAGDHLSQRLQAL